MDTQTQGSTSASTSRQEENHVLHISESGAYPGSRGSSSREGQIHTQMGNDNQQNQPLDNQSIPYGKIHDGNDLKLYEAAVKGDVKKAMKLFGTETRTAILSPITERHQTVLHIAAGAKQTGFVMKMLEHIEPNDLQELRDQKRNNPFCVAVMAGATPIAKVMLKKDPDLLKIRGTMRRTPLHLAAWFGQRETGAFLYEQYKEWEVVENIEEIFLESIRYNLFDLALELFKRYPALAVSRYKEDETALHMLAKNPTAFNKRRGINFFTQKMDMSTQARKLVRSLWENILQTKKEKSVEYIRNNKQLLFDAAKFGNFIFLEELINLYPNVVLELDNDGGSIFHIAFRHGHVTFFSLLKSMGGINKIFITTQRDREGNSLLHLAAKLEPSNYSRPVSIVSGVGLQMQQEFKTFKEVESLVFSSYREMRNMEGLTPRELFSKHHKDLLKDGQNWMKTTAESCMLIATIITTVVYSAGFTVPGDYDDNGIPNHLNATAGSGKANHWNNVTFRIFSVADAIALSFSSLSILMFLSILTTGSREKDFLRSLPLKLMVGIFSLLISIAAMMVSFGLNFYLAYSQEKSKKIPIVIIILVCAPVVVFLRSQYRLLRDICYCLLCSRISN